MIQDWKQSEITKINFWILGLCEQRMTVSLGQTLNRLTSSQKKKSTSGISNHISSKHDDIAIYVKTLPWDFPRILQHVLLTLILDLTNKGMREGEELWYLILLHALMSLKKDPMKQLPQMSITMCNLIVTRNLLHYIPECAFYQATNGTAFENLISTVENTHSRESRWNRQKRQFLP